MKKKKGCKCVRCDQRATEGSAKHPYCKKHFKEEWDNDYDAYCRFIDQHV